MLVQHVTQVVGCGAEACKSSVRAQPVLHQPTSVEEESEKQETVQETELS